MSQRRTALPEHPDQSLDHPTSHDEDSRVLHASCSDHDALAKRFTEGISKWLVNMGLLLTEDRNSRHDGTVLQELIPWPRRCGPLPP